MVPPMPDKNPVHSPHGSLFVTTIGGDLCELNPHTGERKGMLSARIQDALFRRESKEITTIEDTDSGIRLIRRSLQQQDWAVQSSYELSSSARLVYSGDYDIGLAYEMGATLFVASAGTFVGKSVGTPSSATVRRVGVQTLVYLLKAQIEPWKIAIYETGLGQLRELSPELVQLSSPTFVPRMIDTGVEFLLVEGIGGRVNLRRTGGEVLGQSEAQLGADEFVEDAIWDMEGQRVVVLSGPAPKVHLIPINGTSNSIEIVGQGDIYHDDNPRRMLGIDKESKRIFVALKYQVVAIDLGNDGNLSIPVDFSAECSGVAIVGMDSD